MGLFLRCTAATRMTKFLLESNKYESRRSIQQFTRLLATDKSKNEELSSPENSSSTTSIDKRFDADVSKFENESRISIPRSKVRPDEFHLGPTNDPDTFGTLEKKKSYVVNYQEGTEDDLAEDKYTSELPKYFPQKKYVQMIQKYLKQRRFADALDVLQVTMLKEHRVKPEYYIYSILISNCGITGYSKMACKLFNEMKKRGLPVKSSIYTSLFNSFANSPFPSDGLKRTRHLFALMNEKGIEPNQITCHAIIKAFGRCGSIEEAFKVVDYMMNKKMQLKGETMSFLFHACISDKEAGFRHALLVYKKMNQYCITPDIVHFNLLLHCIRDCSMGDIEATIDVLKQLGLENLDKLSSQKVIQPAPEPGYAWEEEDRFTAAVVAGSYDKPQQDGVTSISLENNSLGSLLPNLFSHPPTLGCVISLSEMSTPQDRLFLLGGIEGFLKEMTKFTVKSDIKTINLLLECSPETCTAEEELVKLASKVDLTTDLVFFNTIIRRRIKRQQYAEAKDVLRKISAHGLQPDLMTYTNLAMACRKTVDAYELLKAMDDSGIRPGIEIVTALLGCATCTYQMKYVDLVLDVIDYEEMKVNAIFLRKADEFYTKCLRVLKIRPEKFHPKTLDSMQNFCKKYPKWKENVLVEEEKHPWQHLRQRYPESTQFDKEFFTQHVEKHALKHKFARLGPTTAPKVRLAQAKKVKEEYPKLVSNSSKNKTIVDELEGIGSVAYQKLLPKES